MKISYQQGDMFAGPERVVVHGCNALGKMGSGVAKVVRDHYPEAYAAYMAEFEAHGLVVGHVIWAESRGKLIGNAITQQNAGRDGKVYVIYDGIAMALKAVNAYALAHGIDAIAFPKIGAGLGGGDWTTIERMIETHCTDFQPVVYTLPGVTIPGMAPTEAAETS